MVFYGEFLICTFLRGSVELMTFCCNANGICDGCSVLKRIINFYSCFYRHFEVSLCTFEGCETRGSILWFALWRRLWFMGECWECWIGTF